MNTFYEAEEAFKPTTEEEMRALIGEKVRYFRKEKGLSINALAELSGVETKTLYAIERLTTKLIPTLSTLLKIANFVQQPVWAFVMDFGEAENEEQTTESASC